MRLCQQSLWYFFRNVVPRWQEAIADLLGTLLSQRQHIEQRVHHAIFATQYPQGLGELAAGCDVGTIVLQINAGGGRRGSLRTWHAQRLIEKMAFLAPTWHHTQFFRCSYLTRARISGNAFCR